MSARSLAARYSLKSLSLGPSAAALHSMAISTPLWMRSATRVKSSSSMPRVVMAGAPMRMPPGMSAEVSRGTLFLLRVMCARSRMRSTLAPSMPLGRRSQRMRWLSVPPETRVYPSSVSRLARAAQFLTTCFW